MRGLGKEKHIEKEVKDEVVEEVIRSCETHIKKYGHRKMSLKELDRFCDLEFDRLKHHNKIY